MTSRPHGWTLIVLLALSMSCSQDRLLPPTPAALREVDAGSHILGAWTLRAPLLSARTGTGVASLAGQLYVVAGMGSGGADRVAQRYDPLANSWTLLPPMLRTYVYPAAVTFGGELYVIGGCVLNADCRISASGEAERFNPATNTWSAIPSLNHLRFDAGAVAADGKIWVLGGRSACPPCNRVAEIETYVPGASSWTTVGTAPHSIVGGTAVSDGSSIYVLGQPPSVGNNTLYRYTVATNSWSSVSVSPARTVGEGATLVNGRIYLLPSFEFSTTTNGFVPTRRVLIYDIAANVWSEGPPLGVQRYDPRPTAVGDVVHVAGSGGGNIAITTVEALATAPPAPPNAAPVARAGDDQTLLRTSPAGATVTLDGSRSSDDRGITGYEWALNGFVIGTEPVLTRLFPLGVHDVRLTVTDADGARGTDVVRVTILNNPPVAVAASVVAECVNGGADVRLDGSASSDVDGWIASYAWQTPAGAFTGPTPVVRLAKGDHTVALEVTDNDGSKGTASASARVADTRAPVITADVHATTLWPPNHRMRLVATVSAADDCDGRVDPTFSISMNERDGPGAGHTSPDWEVMRAPGGRWHVYVRAERNGGGADRTYYVALSAVDATGNRAASGFEVAVPHSRR